MHLFVKNFWPDRYRFDIKISSRRSVSKDIIVKDASNCDKGTHTTNVTATNNSSGKNDEALFDTIVPPPGEEEEELDVDFNCNRYQTGSYANCDTIGILGIDSTLYLEDITPSINNGLVLNENNFIEENLISRKWTLIDNDGKEVANCTRENNSSTNNNNYCIISSSNSERAKVKVLLGRFKVKLEDTYKIGDITYKGFNEHWFTGYVGIGGGWNENSSF